VYDAESGSVIREHIVIPHQRVIEIVGPQDCLIRNLPGCIDVLDLGRRVESLVCDSLRSGKDGVTSCTQGAAGG